MVEREAGAAEDWDAVARAISARLRDAGMTQMDVASAAQVSLTTVRELQHNTSPRRRRPQTLRAISEALGLQPTHLGDVLRGAHTPTAVEPPDGAEVGRDTTQTPHRPPTLEELHAEVRDLRARVEAIERRPGSDTAAT